MNKQVILAQICYNTESNGQEQCWPLVFYGEEVLAKSVQIHAPVFTSGIGPNLSVSLSTISPHVTAGFA
jgi:hypothetical protein